MNDLSIPQLLQGLRAADTPGQRATVTVPVNAGAAVRGQFRRNLEVACFQRGVACDIVQQRGVLSTTFLVTMEGEVSNIIPIVEWMQGVA